jgi:hypothetical protein
MVATVLIREKNGAGETATDKTSGTVRFKNADNATVDSNNPIVIPTSSYDYSYEKWMRTNFSVAPGTQIDNMKVYSDGASGFGTGVETYIKNASTTYSTPAEASSISGYTDFFSYTSGSALAVSSGTLTSTGDKGDYWVMIMRVASTATQGALSAETLTLSYDEI